MAQILENLDELKIFLGKYKLPKLTQEEIENLKGLITIDKTEVGKVTRDVINRIQLTHTSNCSGTGLFCNVWSAWYQGTRGYLPIPTKC